MSLDSSRLCQILAQEKKLGCTDKAVIGGLDRFISIWWAQSSNKISNSTRLTQFAKLIPPHFNYASATIEKRYIWIESIFSLLENPSNTTIPDSNTAAATKQRKVIPKKTSSPTTGITAPITTIKGISVTLSERFAKLGVHTIRDLLYYFPNRHLDYSHLQTVSTIIEGKEQSIIANVWEVRITMAGGKRHTEATLGDDSGNIRAIWFNNPYVARQMKAGSCVVMSGRVKIFAGSPVFESPEWELYDENDLIHTGRLVPLYPLTSGLYQRQVRKLIKNTVDIHAPQVSEIMPTDILAKHKLMHLPEAISQAHFPCDFNAKERARKRLAFDELMLLQIGVMAKKHKWQKDQPGLPFNIDQELIKRFVSSLPYTLTSAQNRVISEIHTDISTPIAMSRLLQGEVGSGKTIVALSALLSAADNHCQGALMAPTEILAKQHFLSICKLLGNLGRLESQDESSAVFSNVFEKALTVALLISDIKGSAKKELKRRLSSGEIDIIVGTHALIQKEISFAKLGLVVVDEQHRFGVEQRSTLRQKGHNPHTLVMTATPIPRTLALTMYGDLDLSVIDELPPGRQQIKTKWFSPNQRSLAYRFLNKEVSTGRQAFIICPLVEESDAIQAKAAVAEYRRLSTQVFPNLRLSLLHGRMSASEKDTVMESFNRHESDILVSTPVVEVGIDVPNATVMMIESADRFGLSQLHQFRGRVGRGQFQSYCMLMSENPSDIGRMRLDIIETTQDGFKLADEDLKLRGPGEFFGTRQSGIPDLRMAKLSDVSILEIARAEAMLLFETDPDLKLADHCQIAAELARVWGTKNETGILYPDLL